MWGSCYPTVVHKKSKSVTPRVDLKIQGSHVSDIHYQVENVWIEIELTGLKKPVIVGCIYRHPKGNVNLFTSELEKVIQKISHEDKLCFLCGDLNINALSQHHSATQNFINTILSSNFIPHITLPTRVTETTATLIDHILVKYDKHTVDEPVTSGNIFCDISDHLPNFVLFGHKREIASKERPLVRIFGEKNVQKFRDHIKAVNWSQLDNCNDVNIAYSFFSEKIQTGLQHLFSTNKTVQKKK